MKLFRKSLVVVLGLVMCLSFTACGDQGLSKVKAPDEAYSEMSDSLIAVDTEEINGKTKDAFDWNDGKTIVAAEIVEMSEGGFSKGYGLDGYPHLGVKTCQIRCKSLYYFNYDRLVEAADQAGSTYSYFSINNHPWVGGGSYFADLKQQGIPNLFYGDITDEFIEKLNTRGKVLTYEFYLDWAYRESYKKGDVILFVVDPQVSVNTNPGAEDPNNYDAVIAPFGPDHPEPYLAKFASGKLQLPAELQESFALRRLYDDTEPQLTGIKDGDSVEDVVAFLKAVEQDMARYEEEQKQQPRPTDVSSIK